MDDRSETQLQPDLEPNLVEAILREAGPSPTQDALLPILHAVQGQVGHISKETIRSIADAMNLSRAEVQGVVSFYDDFREAPSAKHVVQLCMAEACQAVGCRALAAHAKSQLGVDFGEATPDGAVEIKAVYCFGNCATGPTIRIGNRVHGRVSPERFDALVAPLRSGGRSA